MRDGRRGERVVAVSMLPLVVLLLLVCGATLVLGVIRGWDRRRRRRVPGRRPRRGHGPWGREELLEQRIELIAREQAVRARYAQVVSTLGGDERATALAPLTEQFLDALIATQDAHDALAGGLEATARRELGRRVGRYRHAVTRLERAWDGIAGAGPSASD